MKEYLSALLTLVLVLSLAIVAAPATPVKAQGTTINVPADNATITIAIATASSGDIINVTANLTENVVVNKNNLTIQGAWASANVSVTAANAAQPVFNVTANNTTIKYLTIKGGASGVSINAVQGKVDSANITGNTYGVWIGDVGTQNRIIRNTIAGNSSYGVRLPGTTAWNEVTYNDITSNGYGVFAVAVPGDPYWMQWAGFNYWGDASGPGGAGPGTGDAINQYVWYNPWLNTSQSTNLASGIADISMAIPLETGWNTLSTPLALAADSNNWNEIVSNSSLNYTAAYTYSANPGWGELSTSNTTVLNPLDAVFIKMTAANIAQQNMVILKVSTATNPPPTKDLLAGWNLIGASMAITDRQLEMWKVLKSVELTSDGKVGYDMVVSPPLASQPPWVYVRGQEEVGATSWEDFEWQNMQFGRGYWIYMENADEMAGFASTPITARVWD